MANTSMAANFENRSETAPSFDLKTDAVTNPAANGAVIEEVNPAANKPKPTMYLLHSPSEGLRIAARSMTELIHWLPAEAAVTRIAIEISPPIRMLNKASFFRSR